MGWIANRSMQRGTSLYDGGPKRKGPLRKIVKFTTAAMSMFDSHSAWLDCGHWSDKVYGQTKAICEKCRLNEPKDKEGDDGFPV